MSSPLNHIAIIMDGNRRWAKEKGFPESSGYIQSVGPVKEVIECCLEHSIPYITLFAFSTENWKRSSLEVRTIFAVMEKSLKAYCSTLMSKKIRLRYVGELSPLPQKLRQTFLNICEETKNNSDLNFILAVNYGGRKEILSAVESFFSKDFKGGSINEKDFQKHLQTSSFPPPDLIVRTGGEQRISNFYLWSSAYSEFYFSEVMWPDFNKAEFKKALSCYKKAKRRFGGSS